MYEEAEEIFRYLSIRKSQAENDYIDHLWNAFLALYENETSGRSFSIMPFHLLFMMAVQYKALRISKLHKKSCDLFFCGVAGRSKKELLSDSLSVFDIALINERTIPEIFQLIDLESEKVGAIKKLIDDRNDRLAHAKGGIETAPDEKIALYIKALEAMQNNFYPMNRQMTDEILKDLANDDDISQILESLLQKHSLDKNDLNDVAKLLLESKRLTQIQWIQFAEYLISQFDFDEEAIKASYPEQFNLGAETYLDNSIFFEELPVTSSNQILDIVKAHYPNLDPYYVASACIADRKHKFDTLWINFKPFADNHFLQQAKISFHQRSWEMYMANVLLGRKLRISSRDEGPDFTVDENIYLECIAPTKGEPGKTDSVPPMFVAKNPSEIMVQDVPVDKMILRITQALKDKALDQYEKWKSKSWFGANKPFIVAINTGDLEYPQDYLGIPLVVKALFGLQYMQISQNGDQGFSWRNEIGKGAGVPVNYFANDSFSFVSGVIFSDETVLNHPEIIGDDCIFVNNPFSDHPVDELFASRFKSWSARLDKDKISLTKNY